MPAWTTFAVASVVLTVLVLYGTHRSQELLDRAVVVDSLKQVPERVSVPATNASTGTTTDDTPAGSFTDGDAPTNTDSDNDHDQPLRFDDPDAVEPSFDREAADGHPPVLTTRMLLVNVLLTQGVALLALAGLVWWTGVPPAALGIEIGGVGWSLVLLGVGLGVLLYAGNEAIAAVGREFGVSMPETLRESLAPTTPGEWGFLAVVVLPVIAVFEELLFRGVLVGAFWVGFGFDPWFLAIASSAVFGLAHGAQGRLGMVVTGLLGLVLAAAFVVTGSLLVVIVAHYVVNLLEFIVREGVLA